jgi:uncharacterized lipoprotein YbaY
MFALNCQASETGSVSGTLNLSVPGKTAAYVQFRLVELQKNESKVVLGQQPFVKATQPLMSFSMNYDVQRISPNRRYKLVVIVAEKSSGGLILGRHDFPIIISGHHSELNIAINIPPEPVE